MEVTEFFVVLHKVESLHVGNVVSKDQESPPAKRVVEFPWTRIELVAFAIPIAAENLETVASLLFDSVSSNGHEVGQFMPFIDKFPCYFQVHAVDFLLDVRASAIGGRRHECLVDTNDAPKQRINNGRKP
jgi:hypothetical protein